MSRINCKSFLFNWTTLFCMSLLCFSCNLVTKSKKPEEAQSFTADAAEINAMTQEQASLAYLYKLTQFLPKDVRTNLLKYEKQALQDQGHALVGIGRVLAWRKYDSQSSAQAQPNKNSADGEHFETQGPLFYTGSEVPMLFRELSAAVKEAGGTWQLADAEKKEQPQEPTQELGTSEYELLACPNRLTMVQVPDLFRVAPGSFSAGAASESQIEPIPAGGLGTVRAVRSDKATSELKESLKACDATFGSNVRQYEMDHYVSIKDLNGKRYAFRELHVRAKGIWIGTQMVQVFNKPEFGRTAIFVQKIPLPERATVWLQLVPKSTDISFLRNINPSEKLSPELVKQSLATRSSANKVLSFVINHKLGEGATLQDLSNVFKTERNLKVGAKTVEAAGVLARPVGAWHSGYLIGAALGGIFTDSATIASTTATLASLLITGYRALDVTGARQSFWTWLEGTNEKGEPLAFARALRGLDFTLLGLSLSGDVLWISENLDLFLRVIDDVKLLELAAVGQMSSASRGATQVAMQLGKTAKESFDIAGRLTEKLDIYNQALTNLVHFEKAFSSSKEQEAPNGDVAGKMQKRLAFSGRIHGLLKGIQSRSDGKITAFEQLKMDLRTCLEKAATENSGACFERYLSELDLEVGKYQSEAIEAFL